MNIGYVVSRFPKTTETFIAREAVGLQRRGHDISVLALRRESNQIVQPESAELLGSLVAADDASPFGLAASQLRWLRRSPRRLAKMWWRVVTRCATPTAMKSPGFVVRALAVACSAPWVAEQTRGRNLDHLHAHWGTHSALLAYQISILTGLRYSVTLHAHDLYIHQFMLGEKLRHAETVVTISEYNRRMIERLYPEVADNIEVVRCGVDTDTIEPVGTCDPIEGRVPRISIVAGLREYKGHAYLIEAHELLHKRGRQVALDIIGDGPLRGELEAMAARSTACDEITFVGAKPADVAMELVGQSDVFVLPSVVMDNGRKDGIPVALMEAMAMTVPAVSTTVSGIPELVEHDVTGLLVDPEDAVQLADAIERLLSDHELRGRLATAGRQRVVDQFDLSQTVEAMDRIVTDAIGQPVVAGPPTAANSWSVSA